MNFLNKIVLMAAVFFLVVGTFNLISAPNFTGYVVKEKNLDSALNNLDTIQSEYNANLENMPPFFVKLFGNEVIDLKITRTDGSVDSVLMKTSKGKIEEINNIDEKTTLTVNIHEDTINEILNSQDQINAIKEALDNKEITYSATKIFTKAKLKIGRSLFTIRSWFT